MTTIYHEGDADPGALDGQHVAVVGYGNQGRSWALNLRDEGLDVSVHVRADESREQAVEEGFAAADIPAASEADVLCLLVPDDVIPQLDVDPDGDALVIVASGYTLAFDRYDPACDVGLVAPRMLGPEVRETYLEGTGFITAVGVHRDETGTARARTLALARALGGLKQGGIELDPMQEAVLDLAVEQVLAPALRKVNLSFTEVMLERGIPLEAILCELFLSGEMERTMRRLRLQGYAGQLEHHSPTSQYGQLSRADRFDDVELVPIMQDITGAIADGSFADEWDAERDAGYERLERLKEEAAGPAVRQWEAELRDQLGETAVEASS